MLHKLNSLEDEMKKCFRCSLCKMIPLPVIRNPRFSDGCPANRMFHVHGYSGSGKSIMSLSLLDGRIEVDETLARITFACTACGLCDVACKFIMDAERHLINMTLREHIVDQGFGIPVHREAIQEMINVHARRETAGENRQWAKAQGLKILPEEHCDVLLFGGQQAVGRANESRVSKKLARLLRHARVDVGILGEEEPDSGLLAYWTGHRDLFVERAKGLNALLEGVGVRTVVTVSGADLGILRAKYPEYGCPTNVEILHATELLERLIIQGRLKLPRPIDRTVTYHDPCYLGRQSEPPVEWDGEYRTSHGCMTYAHPPKPINRGVNGVFDAPRNILRSIKGIDFLEMHRIREYAFCCGGGGGVPLAYPRLALETALHRIEEARAVGGGVLVTACHVCRENLSRAQQASPAVESLPVVDVIDLVFEAAGIGS